MNKNKFYKVVNLKNYRFFVYIFFVLFFIKIVFGMATFSEINLYYLDKDNNGKIDTLELFFNEAITGNLNYSKIFLYSNTGGISTKRLNNIEGTFIFSNHTLSGNILTLNILEQDNFLTGLVINNSTSSHLRLRNNSGIGIKDINGTEINLSLTSSFDNYKNVFYKKYLQDDIENQPLENSQTGILTNSGTENTSSGSQTNSGSENNSSGSLTNSGSQTNSGNIVETKVFTGKIIFQNPSYLIDKDIEKDEYFCDKNQSDCRVNFNLEMDFGSGFQIIGSKYSCLWEFGFTGSLGFENNCNPTTINYPEGIYFLNYKIFENDDNSNFFSKSFKIINEVSQSGTLTNSGTENTSSGSESFSGNVNSGQILDTKIIFQNPSYLIDKDKFLEKYNCDQSKTDCKVNFNLGVYSSGVYNSLETTKYNCLWSFGSGNITGEENNCNPNTITFAEGIFDINYKVFSKTQNFLSSGSITIQNDGFKEENIPVKTVYVGGGVSSSSNYSINISNPQIIVQSGLDEQNNCKKIDCNLNLNYEPKNSKEACFWMFPGGIYDESNLKKCNPGYIKYNSGSFKVTLRVYEAGNEGNFKESYLNFTNNLKTDNKTSKTELKTDTKEELKITKAIISTTGTFSGSKKISGNNINCENDCSINFNGSKSYSFSGELSYNWDFGNGEKSNLKDPKSIKYNSGSYKIELIVKDIYGNISSDNFFVNVGNTEKKELEIQINPAFIISGIVPNPAGVDNVEYIEIKNISNITQNLKGCKIDDEIGKGSSVYEIEKDIYLNPLESKKFYNFDSEINLSNSNYEEVNIICFDKIQDKIFWDFKVPDDFVINKNILNLKKQTVFIQKVIDGDTFLVILELGEKRVFRHIGIDTPETKNPKKEVQKFGIEAYEFAKSTLEGKYVNLEVEKENFVDIYGRMLGYFFIENIGYGEIVLEKGLSKVYEKYDFNKKGEFLNIQNIAKSQKLGIWSINIDEEKDFKEDTKDKILEEIKKETTEIKDEKEEKKIEEEIIKNILGKTSSGIVISENLEKDKKEKILDIFSKKFSQKISKQKKGVKIYGKTIPNITIILEFKKLEETAFFINKAFGFNDIYETKSDNNGNYELLLNDILVGDFEVKNYIKTDILTPLEIAKKSIFDIDIDYIDYVMSGQKTEEKELKIVENIQKVEAKITLQNLKKGILTTQNKITCPNMDDCNINFDGRESIGKKLKYFWDFGNGQTSIKENPASINFKKGNYVISLNITDNNTKSTAYFLVGVEGKTPKVIKDEVKEKQVKIKILDEKQNFDKNNFLTPDYSNYHIIYSFLLFGVFLILSYVILRKKEIL